MTILISDRSAQIIDRLENLVLEAGNEFKILKSKTFGESRTLIDEFKPEIILLDMDMRANKSFDLLKHIKEVYPKTIVLALSTLATRRIREESEKLGVDYFLNKYYEFDKISAIIKKIREERKKGTQ